MIMWEKRTYCVLNIFCRSVPYQNWHYSLISWYICGPNVVMGDSKWNRLNIFFRFQKHAVTTGLTHLYKVVYFQKYPTFYYWKKVFSCFWINLKVLPCIDKYSLRGLGAFWRQAIFGKNKKNTRSIHESITLLVRAIDVRWKNKINRLKVSTIKIRQTYEIAKSAGDKQNLTVIAISNDDNFKIKHPRILVIPSF